MYRSIGGQYDPPPHSGVPNPLGPRVHNWKGGPLNEGSLFHGPIYTRPMFQFPWQPRPLWGVEDEQKDDLLSPMLPVLAIGAVAIVLFWPRGGK